MRLLESYEDDEHIITIHAPSFVWERHYIFRHKQAIQGAGAKVYKRKMLRTMDKQLASTQFFKARGRVIGS